MELSRQEYWSGLPCPSPGNLPDSGIGPSSPESPTLQEDPLVLNHLGSPVQNTDMIDGGYCDDNDE